MAVQADTDQSRSRWHYTEMNDSNFQLRRGSLIVVLVVFLAIFLLTLLSLYFRWACTRPRSTVVGTTTQRPSSSGLDARTIDNLPVMCLEVLRKREGKDSYECSICITGMVEGEKVRVLPACSHAFHPECVDEWLRARSNCPLCRAVLGSAEVVQQPVAADR